MKAGNVLLIGATSAIGRALGQELAASGARLHLAARNDQELERVAADLRVRYIVPVSCSRFEVADSSSHRALLTEAMAALGPLDLAIITIGDLGDQARAELDVEVARRTIESNYTGIVSILTDLANHFERQGNGTIVALSSVAADRGRRANYVYGSAKGGLERFLQGLRARLAAADVRVITIKPGLVDSRMTFGRPGMILVASPRQVARAIVRAIDRKRRVVYIPWFWFWIMLGVRAMPEKLLTRLQE
jgi:short-subunit dehydrogenase